MVFRSNIKERCDMNIFVFYDILNSFLIYAFNARNGRLIFWLVNYCVDPLLEWLDYGLNLKEMRIFFLKLIFVLSHECFL